MMRRDFAGAGDLLAMQRCVQRSWTPRSRWHVGDLAWKRYSIPGRESSWRIALWEDADHTVVAWGWANATSLDVHVDPAHGELAGDVLAWDDEVAAASERSAIVMQTDGHLIAALERAAYRPIVDAPFLQHCLIDLDDSPPTPSVPEGYRLRAVRPDEVEARAAVHRAAWRPGRIGTLVVPPENLDGESGVTTDGFREVMGAWPYRHDLDQVVETPDGTLVASALGWIDDVNGVGELEPVGTDPRHSRLGLGSAVSLACLHALRRAGATRAVVYARGDDAYPVPKRLYFGLGFRPVTRTVTYRR